MTALGKPLRTAPLLPLSASERRIRNMTQDRHAGLMGKMLPNETGKFVIWMGAGKGCWIGTHSNPRLQ